MGLPERSRTSRWLFTFFRFSALVLAVVGLAGVLGFSVSRRTRELGIRAALGGRPTTFLWLVLRGGAMQLLAGLTIVWRSRP